MTMYRQTQGLALIKNANCNAHARRYFFKAQGYQEAQFYLDHYHDIYALEAECKDKPPDEILKIRDKMRPHFEAMRDKALEDLPIHPAPLKLGKAASYLLENYSGLTLFLKDPEVPIDNNLQERLLRGHVVGRKTWYGTHSERGAETAAILFSIVETCKLNHVNPRTYLAKISQDLLEGLLPYAPHQYASAIGR